MIPRRKGISPLIATVLLIAFTISVGAIIGAWVTGFSKGKSEELTKTGANTINCASAGIDFNREDIADSTVIITNSGNINLDSLKITIQNGSGSAVTINQTDASNVNASNPLRPGDKRVISNFSISEGASITITSTQCPNVYRTLKK